MGPTSPFGPNRANKMTAIKKYREHNAYVKTACPADKLLVYNPKSGWAPLCKFLGLKVPDMEFPNKNKGGQIVDDILLKHPRALRQRREVITNFLVSVILVVCVSWWAMVNYQVVKR